MTHAAVTVDEAAEHFDVSPQTVRRWIREGAPCVATGGVGRGRGARLNVNDVARWRANRLGVREQSTEALLQKILTAMMDTSHRDGGNGQPITDELGLTSQQTAALFAHIYRRIVRVVDGA